MSIKYEPSKILRKLKARKNIKRMVSSGRFSLKKSALAFLDEIPVVDKTKVADVALKVFKGYRTRIDAETATKSELIEDPALLIQRVENEVILQVAAHIRETYEGELYTWLPSSANEPDPEHQLNYGKTFLVGEGEQPGDRYGCQCGMEILTKDQTLNLGE